MLPNQVRGKCASWSGDTDSGTVEMGKRPAVVTVAHSLDASVKRERTHAMQHAFAPVQHNNL